MFHAARIFYCVFAVMQHIGVVLGGVLFLNLIAAIYSRQISICILSHDVQRWVQSDHIVHIDYRW